MKLKYIKILLFLLSYHLIINAISEDKNFYLFDDVQEIGLGLTVYNTSRYIPYKFFILNVKDIEKLYIYVDINYTPFSTLFITKEEKYTFTKNILEYKTHLKYKCFVELNPGKYDYLIIYVLSFFRYKGFMNIATDLYTIEKEQTFNIKNYSYIMLRVKNENDTKKYVLSSSEKNIGILREIFNPNNLTDKIFLTNISDYIYIYIN